MTTDGASNSGRVEDDESADSELAHALESYLGAIEEGRSVDLERLAAAHPAIADQLRSCLGILRLAAGVERDGEAGPSSGSEDGSPPEKRLGDFRLLRPIGRGGMGIVYEAEQLSLHRRVALKVLPFAAALDQQQLQRFKIEAQAAAHLHHTNIVPVFSVGCEGGVHYYAMQFIEGQTLAALVRDLRCIEGMESAGPAGRTALQPSLADEQISVRLAPARSAPSEPGSRAPTEGSALVPTTPGRASTSFIRSRAFFHRVARLGIQAAEALDYAHRAGIIHRDIKPANVLVDVLGNLWITDFGLARMQTDSGLTLSGDVLGTLRYISPEQALGRRAIVDHRTDIYSLGTTLYEVLTLQAAFAGQDRHEVLRKIIEEEPTPLRLLNKSVPRDLETIVLKALAREVGQRYATALDLADDLRRFLDHRPIQARRPSLWMRAKKLARRHRIAVASAASVLFVLGVAGRAVFTQQRRNQELALAVRQDQYAGDVSRAFHLVERGELAGAERILTRYRPSAGELDVRSFPWHSLWQTCRAQPRTLPGHTDSALCEVYHVEFSPQGDTLASCGNDGTVRLWDPESGRLLRVLRGHDGDVNYVTFSPDGSKLGTGGDDGAVRLWDLSGYGDPKPLTLGKHDDWVTCVLFTPDGRRLISTGRDRHLKLWDVEAGRMLRSVAVHRDRVEGMALSPDGRTLATASADHTAKLWDAETFEERRLLWGHGSSVQSMAFSHAGDRLASAGFSGRIILWNPSRGQAFEITDDRHRIVQCVTFSPDDRLVASCGDDASIRVWDAQTLLPLGIYRSVPYRLWCVAFSRDGRTLASCGDDGAIRLWDMVAPRDRVVLHLPVSRVDSVALTPGSIELIVAGPPEGADHNLVSVSSWDLRQGSPLNLRQITAPGEVRSCILSRAGRSLVTYDGSGMLRLWDLAMGSSRQAVQLPQATGYTLSGFEESRLLLTLVERHSMEPVVWDLGAGTGSLRFAGEIRGEGIASAIAGNTVVADNTASVFRWDLATDQVTRVKQPKHTTGRWVNQLAVSRDGRHVASGGTDHSLLLWNARSLEWEATLPSHRTSVQVVCLDFSPDGKVLASATDDGTIALWDVSSRQQLMTLEGVKSDDDGPRHLRFSPDGSVLVYCCTERKQGIAIVWHAPRDSEN
jgi:eukaryotic-like serine/threonine-protein kinase